MREVGTIGRVVSRFLGLLAIWLVLVHSNCGLPGEVTVRSGENLSLVATPFLQNCAGAGAFLPAMGVQKVHERGEGGAALGVEKRVSPATKAGDQHRETRARTEETAAGYWALVGQMDTSEVLTPLEAHRMSVSSLAAALVSVALTISIWLSHSLTRPIRQFTAVARQASRLAAPLAHAGSWRELTLADLKSWLPERSRRLENSPRICGSTAG